MFPLIVEDVFGIFTKIVNFDLMPSQKINNFWMEYTETERVDIQMELIGFETKNFILNAGTLLFVQYMFVVLFLLKALVIMMEKTCTLSAKISSKVRKYVTINHVFQYMIEGQIEFLVCAII